MHIAVKESLKAYKKNLVPVGAVLVKDSKIISKAHNLSSSIFDHAEILVLKEQESLKNLDLYVTLEPCLVCTSLIKELGIKRLFFGAYSTKTGCVDHNQKILNNSKTFIVGGIMESMNSKILSSFFKKLRQR